MFILPRNYKQLLSLLKYSNATSNAAKVRLPTFCKNQCISLQDAAKRFCSSEPMENNEALTLSDEEINSLTNGDEEEIHRLKVLLLESEISRQEGRPVPSSMKTIHWKELLERQTRTGRRKYLEYLFKLEKKNENLVLKKARRREEIQQRMLETPLNTDEIRYHLGHNSIFLRIYDSTIMNLCHSRLIRAMQFGQQIVIDCGYESHMTKMETKNCVKQLTLAFAENRAHNDPFDLHFCNLHPTDTLPGFFHHMIPTMHDDDFPINLHEQSYLDLFPRDNLVYLTPHCREELHEYDHNAVYIIGAMVDKISNEPLSLAKAKREKLKMAKLPLDKYLCWGAGSGKSLTINQVLSVMLDMKWKNDWKFALRHVPRRKLLSEDMQKQMMEEARSRLTRSNRRNAAVWKPTVQQREDSRDVDRSKQRLLHLKNILNE